MPLPRPNAPWPLTVALNWRGNYVRQGTITVHVVEQGTALVQWESDARVLTPASITNLSFLMPPFSVPTVHDSLEVQVRFNDGGHLVHLGGPTLPETGDAHQLVLALCMPLAGSALGKALMHGLALEGPMDDPRRDVAQHTPLHHLELRARTLATQLREEDMPESGIGWCAYDLVVIAEGRIASLRPRQAQALERWILAGGSCCLVTDDRLPPGMAQMLAHAGMGTEPASGEHLRLRLGLGRIVLAPRPDDHRDGTRAWLQNAAFLWKFRSVHAAEFESGEDVASMYAQLVQKETAREAAQPHRYVPDVQRILSDHALNLDGVLTQLLWPDHAVTIPIWLIITIFLAFVIAVGPLDWFLLGWLRAHRFTWMLFPAMAIACTWSTVAISRSYMGAHDRLEQLEIVDLGPADAVLRHNRINLVFNGGARTAVATHENGLWSPLFMGSSMDQSSGSYRPRRTQQMAGDLSAPLYHGTLPTRYDVTQEIPQWTPLLSRELSLEPEAAPWPLGLDRITDLPSVAAVAISWLKSVGGDGLVIAYHAGDVVSKWGKDEPTGSHGELPGMGWVRAVNCQVPYGWFAIASGESPAGGATYDDLPLHDPSDPDEFLVVFLQHRPHDVLLVRRLFHSPHAAAQR